MNIKNIRMFKFSNRKGVTLADLQTIALTFVMIGILAGVGVLINTQFARDADSGAAVNDTGELSRASYAVNNSTRGILNLVARLPLIGTIAGFIVLLGFVLTLLVRRMGGQ